MNTDNLATASERRAQVLIADDDLEMCAMLQEYLSKERFDVRTAHDGLSVLKRLEKHRADIVLLDVSMPNLSGFDVLRQLRAQSTLPVLMLTARDDDVDRILGLELGADDYLTKPFNARELVARIHAILRRAQASHLLDEPQTLKIGLITLETGLRRAQVEGEVVPLTDAEYRVLELLARNAGRVMSRSEITRRALGRTYYTGMDRSIDTHVSNLRRKLGPRIEHSSPILGVRGAGYLLGTVKASIEP